MKNNVNLSDGKVMPVLIKFTIPILLSILLQTTYGTVDLLVVGQFSGIADVSGVTIGSQLMQTITAVFTGLSMGTTILLGQHIGARQEHKATKTVGVSVALFLIIAIVVTFGIVLFNQQLTSLMKTPPESIKQTEDYLFYCGMGAVFIVAYNLLGSIFRGIGDSKTPLMTVAISCVINVILDLVFVAWFKLGSSGAALATTIAQASSVFLSILMIRKRKLPFEFSLKTLGFDKAYIKKIMILGIPIALQGGLVTISFLFVTAIINQFGVEASSGVGIVAKITALIMIVPSSFSQSLSAFTAQNFGANKMSRAKQGLKYGISISLIFGVFMAYTSAFHGEIFTRIFTNDVAVTESALLYLKTYSIDTMLVAIMFCFNGYFNGCGKTTFVMLHSLIGAFAIRVPVTYAFSLLANTSLFWIGLATPITTAVQIVACVWFFMYTQKKMKTKQNTVKIG